MLDASKLFQPEDMVFLLDETEENNIKLALSQEGKKEIIVLLNKADLLNN